MPDCDKITQFLFKLQLAAPSTRPIDYYVNFFFSQQHHFVNQRHFLVAAAVNGFHHDSFNFFFNFLFYPFPPLLGLIWSEVKQLWDVGLQEYIHDMWNVIDFITNSLYVATVALRVVSYFQVSTSI